MKTCAAGPSCFDGDNWIKIIVTNIYGTDGNNIPNAIAETSKWLCIAELDSHKLKSIETLMTFQLILLNEKHRSAANRY